ncbi:MAG: trigger factor [Bacilli bacterium]|nr:trigger factor [Bacilli bacterium]
MKNVKEIKIEIKGKDWENAIDAAFNKNKKDIKMAGFRKGAVPKEIYIKKAGIESLFAEASDIAIEDAYKKALDEFKEELVCEPAVAINKCDKEGIEYTFTLISHPEVKLGAYKNLGIKKEAVKVTKEEINEEIEHMQDRFAEKVVKENGEVVVGDTATIDFEGKVEGKVIDGGTGKNYPLEIGSHSFIPGFEEGVVGMKVGETKVLNLKFPEEYVEALKGKDVEFTVTLNKIETRVRPEINKDFFEDLAIEGIDSLEKLEDYVKGNIKESKEKNADNKYTDEVLHKACDNMKVEINKEIIDSEVERMIRQYSQELRSQGFSFEQYLQMTGQNIENVRSMMSNQAEARIKTRYLLEAVSKEEKVKVTKEEIKKYIKDNADKYSISEQEFTDYVGGEDAIEYDLKLNKALDIVKEA